MNVSVEQVRLIRHIADIGDCEEVSCFGKHGLFKGVTCPLSCVDCTVVEKGAAAFGFLVAIHLITKGDDNEN
jgi:hypothetical protein